LFYIWEQLLALCPAARRARGLARYRAIRAAFQRKLNFKNAKLLRLLDAQLDNPRCETTESYL
jgi:hypothetical protein